MKRAAITISVSGIVLASVVITGFPLITNHPGAAGIVVGLVIAKLFDR